MNNGCCCGKRSETQRKTVGRRNVKPGQTSTCGPLCVQTSILDLTFTVNTAFAAAGGLQESDVHSKYLPQTFRIKGMLLWEGKLDDVG